MPEQRLRRTILLTPGVRGDRLAKAVTLDVDAVAFDLEDGVAPSQKADARGTVAEALASLEFGHRERIVRVNAVGTPDFAADMEALAFAHIDTVLVPKVESADQLRAIDERLAAEEHARSLDRQIEIIATIETARGLLNALSIADASERISGLFFGSGDYAADTGVALTERGLAVPRAIIVAAAAAAGAQALDAAYFTAVKDAEATRADAELARELGFSGKVVFHPNQVASCNAVFSPGAEEIARAKKIIAAFGEAQSQGQAVAYVDGEFLAIDIVLMAERILARAEQLEMRAN